jgi:hypothetical protein
MLICDILRRNNYLLAGVGFRRMTALVLALLLRTAQYGAVIYITMKYKYY